MFVKEDTAAENIVKAREIYIRQADLDAFGYTPGCKKCQSMLGRGKGETSAPYSDICRTRLTAEISKTPEGAACLARMNERVDRYVAERIQEGHQHAPQGGLPVMLTMLYPYQSCCRSILLKSPREQAHPPLILLRRSPLRQFTMLSRQLTRVKLLTTTSS